MRLPGGAGDCHFRFREGSCGEVPSKLLNKNLGQPRWFAFRCSDRRDCGHLHRSADSAWTCSGFPEGAKIYRVEATGWIFEEDEEALAS